MFVRSIDGINIVKRCHAEPACRRLVVVRGSHPALHAWVAQCRADRAQVLEVSAGVPELMDAHMRPQPLRGGAAIVHQPHPPVTSVASQADRSAIEIAATADGWDHIFVLAPAAGAEGGVTDDHGAADQADRYPAGSYGWVNSNHGWAVYEGHRLFIEYRNGRYGHVERAIDLGSTGEPAAAPASEFTSLQRYLQRLLQDWGYPVARDRDVAQAEDGPRIHVHVGYEPGPVWTVIPPVAISAAHEAELLAQVRRGLDRDGHRDIALRLRMKMPAGDP